MLLSMLIVQAKRDGVGGVVGEGNGCLGEGGMGEFPGMMRGVTRTLAHPYFLVLVLYLHQPHRGTGYHKDTKQ